MGGRLTRGFGLLISDTATARDYSNRSAECLWHAWLRRLEQGFVQPLAYTLEYSLYYLATETVLTSLPGEYPVLTGA